VLGFRKSTTLGCATDQTVVSKDSRTIEQSEQSLPRILTLAKQLSLLTY
jgi:hypothetical protein